MDEIDLNDVDIATLAERTAQTWGAFQANSEMLGHAITRHVTTRRGPMGFSKMPSLVELYTDLPKIEGADICKATQTGFSELVIQLALHFSGDKGRIVSYVVPSHTLRNRFVQRRVDPLLKDVPEYKLMAGGFREKGRRRGAENLRLKQMGNGAILFLGANSAADFVEFSTDVLVIDEYDLCMVNKENIARAQDRLRMSPYPQMFRAGNPTLPRVGIADYFDKGDGRVFHWRCHHCGERQPIDFFANVVMKDDHGQWIPRDYRRAGRLFTTRGDGADIRPVCRKCDRPFNREIDGASWVAERPGRRRSYRMSRLDMLTDRIWGLYMEWMEAQESVQKKAAFHNSVLGQAYEAEGMKMTWDLLSRACRGRPNDAHGTEDYSGITTVMGVDVGTMLNVTIDRVTIGDSGEKIRTALHISAVPRFEVIKDLIRHFNVRTVCIDAFPETRKAQELRDWAHYSDTDCTVWLAQFHPTDRVGREDYGMRPDYGASIIKIDRTQIMDATFEDIKFGRRIFPSDATSIPYWSNQMQASVRTLDMDSMRIVWTEGKKPDHYRLADVYARAAADMDARRGGFSV